MSAFVATPSPLMSRPEGLMRAMMSRSSKLSASHCLMKACPPMPKVGPGLKPWRPHELLLVGRLEVRRRDAQHAGDRQPVVDVQVELEVEEQRVEIVLAHRRAEADAGLEALLAQLDALADRGRVGEGAHALRLRG